MKLMRQLMVCVLFCPVGLCAQTPITAEELSRLLEFSGKIVVSDKTQEVSAKHGDAIVSALLFEPDDDGFSTIQALTTKGGFLLSADRRGKLEGAGSAVRKIQLANGVEGYVGLEGAGPGGESYVALAHLPDKDLDLQFKIIISNDGATQDSSADIAKYHSILRNGSSLRKLLDGMLAQGVNNVTDSQHVTEKPQVKPPPGSGTSAKIEEPGKIVGKQIEAPAAVMAEPTPKPRSKIWWQVGGVLALVVLLALLLKKKKA